MSMPLKSKVSSAWTWSTSSSPNETCLPIERDEASATTLSAGKSRSARMVSISRPTLPVAPTTATLKPICCTPRELEAGWECRWLLTYDAARRITSGRSPRSSFDGDDATPNSGRAISTPMPTLAPVRCTISARSERQHCWRLPRPASIGGGWLPRRSSAMARPGSATRCSSATGPRRLRTRPGR